MITTTPPETQVLTVEEKRPCLLCDRMCMIISERGGLKVKEPCPNNCGIGYMKEAQQP